MAIVLEFPIAKLELPRDGGPQDKDRHAEIIELSDFRPSPIERAREWQAFRPFNAHLCLD